MRFQNIADLNVSQMVLGTALFGTKLDDKEAFRLMDRYVELGGNCLDTARLYGFTGKSEQVIGNWLRARPDLRDKMIISTKGGHPELETMHISRLDRKELEQDLDASLKALGVDCIDLYWLHRDDPARPVGQMMETLNDFVRAGKVRHIGASNWRADRLRQAARYAADHGLEAFFGSQIQWNLACPNPGVGDPTTVEMGAEEYACCKELGLSLFAFSSQAKGIFSILESGGEQALPDRVKMLYLNERTRRRYEKVLELSRKYEIPVSSLVLSYVYSNRDFPSFVLMGPVEVGQLEESMSHSDFLLSPEELDWLKE